MAQNIVPLKDLCNNFKKDIVDGPFGANLKREHYKLSGIPVLKIQNIKSFNITLKKMDYVDLDKYKELERHSYKNGDIVMTKLGNPLGESAIVEDLDDGLIVADLVRIRAQKIDTKYLCYHLNSPVTSAFINSQQKGTTRPRVRISVVRELPIYAPHINEQKRIVAILDQAFADIDKARANAEQNLKNARELFESYLQQVFSQRGGGWEDTRLIDIADNLDKKRVPITKKDRIEGKYPYYGASGIVDHVNGYIFDDDLLLVSEDGANLLARTYPIAFSATGKCWVNNHAHVLRFKDLYVQKFMEYYLNSISLSPYVSGMAQPKLNQKALNSIPVPKVNEVIAKKIVSNISQLENEVVKIEALYKAKLNALDELKKSILQKAFSGELTRTVDKAASNLIQFPTKLANIGTTDLHAGILALAYQAHEQAAKQQQFGHVKAEKIAHLAEAMLGIELNRTPIQDAAGPNDYLHFKKKVEPRAKKAGFFSFKGTKETGYILQKGHSFDAIADKARQALSDAGYLEPFENMMQLLVKMDTAKAEIFATVYAAWNNLLLDNADISDEAIVQAARENWHDSKLKIPRERFFKAIAWMREENIVPLGRGKYVHASGERQ